jgi:exopolysaccharide biosynthesis polyprenyl glycosylphosphotransferase
MIRRFSINFAIFSLLLDALLVCAGLELATRLRPSLAFLPFAAHYPELIQTPWPVFLVFAAEWTAILLLFSVYDGRRNLRGIDEFVSLTLGSLLAAVALAGTLYFSYREVSRLLFFTFILITYLSLLAWRFIARSLFRLHRAQSGGQRKVLIVGAGPVGRELQTQIQTTSNHALQVVGFLDDDPAKRRRSSDLPSADILGPLSIIQSIVQEKQIDDVIIALPQSAYQRLDQLVGELHRLPVKVWIIPDYFKLALYKAAVEQFAGIPLLDLRAPAISDQQRTVKRLFDLIVTLLSLPIALPVMGIAAIGVRLESQGPVILRQPRMGENGRLFDMLKIRTMFGNADQLRETVEAVDDQGRLIHKTAHDPRVTHLGRYLRRFSVDELPQLFNILKGEMSLVGPRPELPYLVERYEPWQRQRFAIPQGLTGWWQINGRSDRPMHLHTEDDLYYIQHYSLLLDIYILVKTAAVVVQGKGAF